MVEKVKYNVIRQLGKVEIRKYKSLICAKVDSYGNEGFNILFNFISGSNKKKTKLTMTAPVISEKIKMTAPVLSDSNSLSFVVPEKYTLETIPQPLDERIRIVEIPDRILAVLRFSGRWSESIFNLRSKELLEELAKSEIKSKGSVFAMLYNAPFTPWFLRRNEVAIEVSL